MSNEDPQNQHQQEAANEQNNTDKTQKQAEKNQRKKQDRSGKSVDQSWKEAVQQEKEKLKENQQSEEDPEEVYPEASFQSIVGSFGMQVAIALGQVENPMTGEKNKDLEQAKHFIDSLRVLREKTEGNLTDEEEQHLNTLISELQMQYVNEMKGGGGAPSQQQKPSSGSSSGTTIHTP